MVNPKKVAHATSKRVTIMLEASLYFILRNKQSKQIAKKQSNVSFSEVINDSLEQFFKGVK